MPCAWNRLFDAVARLDPRGGVPLAPVIPRSGKVRMPPGRHGPRLAFTFFKRESEEKRQSQKKGASIVRLGATVSNLVRPVLDRSCADANPMMASWCAKAHRNANHIARGLD